jgi:diguanylate cyclase (GGDEF)-like protein
MRLTAAPGDFSRVDEFFAYPNAAACQEALTELLLVKSKGVALKLYLENFKAFNDMFGYQFGGLFLKEIARYLCGIPGADVYRPVGVEFIIILEGQNRSGAIAVLEDIIDRFNSSWSINNMDCMCSCNLGMAFYPGHASTAAELMDQLGHAADASAEQGPNQYAIFDTELNQKLYRLNAIARMIPSAIESGQLELRYRPSHSVPGNRFTRADSYMRLLSPEFGVIQASEFIPVAEETGLIYMVSQYAVTEACKLIARLNELEVDFESIAVPISPIQFMQERFVGDVASAIETAGIEPGQLALEVPESVALSSFASGREKMAELSDMGVEIVF